MLIVGKSDVGGDVTNKRKNKNKEEKFYKPKANNKGKENSAIFFKTWPSLSQNENKIPMCHTLHVLENISNSTANHSKFQLGNKKPQEISNEG